MAMKTAKSILFAFLFVLAGLSPLFAQQSMEARIDKIRLTAEKTPYFSSSSHSSQNFWLAVNVDFSTKAANEWINEMDVRFVLLMELENGRFVYMDKTIPYVDVQNGRQHHVVAYVKPAFFERYMRSSRPDAGKISVHVEISAGGRRLAADDKYANPKIPKNWFGNLNKLRDMSGELRAKSTTPFAPLDYDYYEEEKPDTKKGN